MFFLNLSAAEFFTLLGALSGLTAALYLLDRMKRTRVVSTLRFWAPAASASERQSRKRVREPWSLVLQLVSLVLLLLAIAQLQLGSREHRGRDHVLLLDTSAWAAQRSGHVTILNREQEIIARYIATLPPRDRIMLVRADALATPVTPFTADRVRILKSLRASAAGFSALNLAQALSFAQQAQRWSRGEPGEVVYVGPGMVPESDIAALALPNLRVIPIQPDRRHVGIRGVGVRRSEADENAWQAIVMLQNYGPEHVLARLQTQFAGTAFAARSISLSPGEETAAEYNFVTHSAGQLVAQVEPGDSLVSDQRVAVELPRIATLRVAVFTDRPEALKPLFATHNGLQVRFFRASEARAGAAVDLAVFDRTAPPKPLKTASICIDPPRQSSPLPVKTVVNDAVIANWNSEIPLGAGLHTKDTRIRTAEVFQTFDGDVPIGSVPEGAVVVARNAAAGYGKIAVIGFDPLASELKFQLATPLLFANLLRWISPDVFRPVEAMAERVGAVTVTLDASERVEQLRVLNPQGSSVAFLTRKQSLELFASSPQVLRVISGDRERVISITVPDVAAFQWKLPEAARGLPGASRLAPSAIDLWKWLAVIAALALYAEWMLFGRRRVRPWTPPSSKSAARPLEQEPELATK